MLDTLDVLEALNIMRQASALPLDHPLCSFLSLMGSAHGLTGRALTEMRVFQTLCLTIGRQLRRHRVAQGLTRQDARGNSLQDLQRDFRAGNAEREAWSVLYYRFVRLELDLSIGQIARLVSQTVRTLNRRQQQGLARLTQTLLRQEQRFRHSHRHAALQGSLPAVPPPHLYGRQADLECADGYLSSGLRQLVLYGARRSGKTALALSLAQRLIEADALEYVLWVQRPSTSLPQLQVELAARLGLASGVSPSDVFRQAGCLVVLDDAQALLDAGNFEKIQVALAPAQVIVCTEQLPQQRLDVPCLEVGPLDHVAALRLLDYQAQFLSDPQLALLQPFDTLIRRAGAYPGALLDAVWQVRTGRCPAQGDWPYAEIPPLAVSSYIRV